MNKPQQFCIVLFLLQVVLQSTNASTINYETSCRTFDGQLGLCLHYNKCEKHRNLVFKPYRSYDEVLFLKQNQCEPTYKTIQYNKVDFYFCCSRDEWTEDTLNQMNLLQLLDKRKKRFRKDYKYFY